MNQTIIDSTIYSLPQTNQGPLPACDAFEIAKYVQLLIFKQTGNVINISQRWIYANCAPAGIAGLSTESVLKFGMKVGFCTSDLIDENVNVPETVYRNLKITPEMLACAAQYKIGGYVPIEANPIQIQQAILSYSAVLSSIPVGTITPQAVLPPLVGNGLGLHAALLYGIGPYNDDFMVYWDNWWGYLWGNQGYGTFLWSQFKNTIIHLFAITKIIISPMQPFSKSFQAAITNTIGAGPEAGGWEGGYTNDPNDPGGETNFGISKRSYPNEDIKNMTRGHAMQIYFSDFWTPIHGDSMPEFLAMNVFDEAVNTGVGEAIHLMQKVLGVISDGKIGPQTLAAMTLATHQTAIEFETAREVYYQKLSGFSLYGHDWIFRSKGTLAASLATVV